jgi:hypothetical protein
MWIYLTLTLLFFITTLIVIAILHQKRMKYMQQMQKNADARLAEIEKYAYTDIIELQELIANIEKWFANIKGDTDDAKK